MSKISLSPSPTGSAVYTIASPAGSTDRTLTLPDAAGTVALTTDIPAAATIASTGEAQAGTNNTNFLTPLRMREGFNASGSAPVFAARAWVNFKGTGTVAIRASGNVSSITDNGTGNYTVNFTTAMPDANYSVVGMGSGTGSPNRALAHALDSTVVAGSVRVKSFSTSADVLSDEASINVAIFR